MNENAGDVIPFQRPSEKDFRDVTAEKLGALERLFLLGKSFTTLSYNTMWPYVGQCKGMTTPVPQTISGIPRANPSIMA